MSVIQCPECAESFRKESYLTHMKKNHPSFLWSDTVRFHPEGAGLASKTAMADMIKILRGEPVPLFIGASTFDAQGETELYLDASSGCVYNKETTAIKHVLNSGSKHANSIFSLLKETLTQEVLVSMLEFMLEKPTEKIIDQKVIAKKDKVIQDMQKELDILRINNSTLRDRCNELESGDRIRALTRRNQTLETDYASLDTENAELYNKISNLERQLKQYRPEEMSETLVLAMADEREAKLNKEIHEYNMAEKVRKSLQKDIAKREIEIEKLRKDNDKYKRKNDNKKAEIQALKLQLKNATQKNTTRADDDSSSDSD